MTLAEFLERAAADREARTQRVRHGQGVLTLLDGVPASANGCLLPDGTATDAECLLPHIAVDEARRVWSRRLPGTIVRRRGRLVVEPNVALRFVDERDADLYDVDRQVRTLTPSLEHDLGLSQRIRELARSDMFATLLYGALCNTVCAMRQPGQCGTAVGGTRAASWLCCVARATTWTGIARWAKALLMSSCWLSSMRSAGSLPRRMHRSGRKGRRFPTRRNQATLSDRQAGQTLACPTNSSTR